MVQKMLGATVLICKLLIRVGTVMERGILSKWALLTCLCLIVSCSQDVPVTATHDSKKKEQAETQADNAIKGTHLSYQKPGAAVRLKHNYDGHSEVGKPELLRLIFSEAYNTGNLNIHLKADPSLMISPPASDYNFAMTDENYHPLNISVNPQREGKYYLRLFVTAEGVNSPANSRVFAIAFYIGDAYQQAKTQSSQQNENQGKTAERIIRLPSQETVIQ
jgi:hypothetical protein